MYNTWNIACNIFPFWAAVMLWLIYLLFRGERVGKELVISTRKEFYSKCYELEKSGIRDIISMAGQNNALIPVFCENISKNTVKSVQEEAFALEAKLRSEGKWIERNPEAGRAETDYSKVPKRKKGFDFISQIPNENHATKGYKAFRESKKEVITKPISLIPESTTSYDVELFKNSIIKSITNF
jgi:hypothetical protein